MTAPQSAPRPSVTPADGGAPRPDLARLDGIATLVERLGIALEALEGQTLTALAPFVDDLEAAAEQLENVLETGRTPVRTGPALLAAVPTFTGGPA